MTRRVSRKSKRCWEPLVQALSIRARWLEADSASQFASELGSRSSETLNRALNQSSRLMTHSGRACTRPSLSLRHSPISWSLPPLLWPRADFDCGVLVFPALVPAGPVALPVVLEPGTCVVCGVDFALPLSGLTACCVCPEPDVPVVWASPAVAHKIAAAAAAIRVLLIPFSLCQACGASAPLLQTHSGLPSSDAPDQDLHAWMSALRN